jgi:hypothetical protein
MRIILHIGTHKTGTTSIQKFCARNRERLRSGGLWYPDYDLIGKESHYAHHHLANAIAGLPTSRGGLTEAGGFFDAVRAQADAGETVLISAEALWRHVSPPAALAENERTGAGTDERYWQARRAFVKQVAAVAGTAAVEIVAVLRRQDDCAESMFKERVKGTSYTAPFEDYIEAFSHRFRYFDQLSVWAEIFPKVRGVVYDDLSGAPDLVAAFFEALHVPLEDGLERAPKFNVSMSNDLIAYKRHLNRAGYSEEALYEFAMKMQADRFGEGLRLDRGSTVWPGTALRQAFVDRFEDENAQVLRSFTGLRRARLFPPLAEDNRPAYPGLSDAAALAIGEKLGLSDAAGAV